MKLLAFVIISLVSTSVFAQKTFDIKKASTQYDVRLTIDKCDDTFCSGNASYELFKKGQSRSFQAVRLKDVEFMLEEADLTNAKDRYDAQSTVFFEDYNFDGIADLALRDGNNSGYGGPSYQIYLYSKAKAKFVRSPQLTDLNQNEYLGMMEVDRQKKLLRTASKSGCCWHQARAFKVVGDRPKKVFEETEDATIADDKKVRITTRTLIGGRWRTRVKYVKREE